MTTTAPTLPREMFPGVHWLGTCLEVLPSIQSMYLKDAGTTILHAHQSFFLVAGTDATMIIDTGQPQHWPQIEEQLELALDGRALTYVMPTHPEYVHYGLLPYWLEKYPEARAVGDTRNFDLFHPDLVDRFDRREPGDTIDLGGRTVTLVEAYIHDLPNTLWAYDDVSQVFFTSDAFAYSHEHNAGECALTSDELPPNLDDVAMTISSALHWARYVDDVGPLFARIHEFIATHPVRAIAPTHGSFIVDPDTMLSLLPQGFLEARDRARG